MELLKQLAKHKHHTKDNGKLVVEWLLIVHEPSVEDYDVIEADAVGGHRAQVYYVLAQSVLVPVRDGEDQEGKRYQGLDDAWQVLLDHRY